jgi:UDP-N-acetylglucosamine 4,6-dehydratase/5-epimerase
MNLSGRKIMIFGGTGSLGRALVRRLSTENQLILFSRDEAKHWTIKNHLTEKDNVKFVVGDIRDAARVEEAMLRFNPDVVIMASALKQVDTCELSPYESVQTNILGIRNVVDAVTRQVDRLTQLDAVLMVSTDKACAPVNVYGMCKAIAERLVTSACISMERPRFVGVRYGNVLESRGSIIPLFRHQGEFQSCLTVTHPEMTRFIMTLDQSIDLIISTILGAKSGEMWLPKLNAMNIMDLAEIFSERFSKPIKIVGIRPGEKLHEDLISRPESLRVRDEDGFYKMSPAHSDIPLDAKIFDYVSNQDVLPRQELATYLDELGIFTRSMDQFLGREIEEIKTSA